MNSWIPVIGTLLGAIIAGTISIIVHRLSNRHAIQNAKLLLAEERAKWAIEKRLARVESFFNAIDRLRDVTIQFRVQQAWQATYEADQSTKIPEWVCSYDKAREEWEEQLGVASRQLLFQDEAVRVEYQKRDITWVRWLSGTRTDSAKSLMDMERDIQEFSEWLAKQYRTHFENRVLGTDCPKNSD